MSIIVAVAEELARVCIVVAKIEIDLCVLAVYNRITVLHVSVVRCRLENPIRSRRAANGCVPPVAQRRCLAHSILGLY
jgi:hypothetical protein